jgi:septal ring factor EnvC (AmiA/AmiB activator)
MRELGRAYRTASTLTAMDRSRVYEYYRTLDALALERRTLPARGEEIAPLQPEATRARAALDKALAARNVLVKSIDERRDLNAQLMSELQAAQQKLQTSIGQMESGRGNGTLLPLRPFQWDLPWPAKGTVSRRFGRQSSSRSGRPS